MMFAESVLKRSFIRLRKLPSITSLLKSLYHKWALDFIKDLFFIC